MDLLHDDRLPSGNELNGMVEEKLCLYKKLHYVESTVAAVSNGSITADEAIEDIRNYLVKYSTPNQDSYRIAEE